MSKGMITITCLDERYSDGGQWEAESLDAEVEGMMPTIRAWAKEATEKALQAGEEPEDYEKTLATMRKEYRDSLRILDPVTGEWTAEGTLMMMHTNTGSIDTEEQWMEDVRENPAIVITEDGSEVRQYATHEDEWSAYIQDGTLVDVAFTQEGEWVEV